MTSDEVVRGALGDNAHSIWQITPTEMPPDLRPQAWELWQKDGVFYLFQLFVRGKRSGDWYSRIEGSLRFVEDREE